MEFELELSAETVFQWILTFSEHWQWRWHVRMGKEWLDEARVDEQSGTIKNSTTRALTQSFDNQNTRKKFWILDKFELWICRVVQSWDRWSNSLSGSIPIAARSAWQWGGATKYQPVPKYRGGHILLTHRGHCPHIIIVCLKLLTGRLLKETSSERAISHFFI